VLGSFPARAQVHLTWNACDGNAAAVANVNFDCDPLAGSVYHLLGTFDMPETQVIFGADATLDFLFWESADTPPFWQFDYDGNQGTCNQRGIGLSVERPALVCQNSNRALCGDGRCFPTIFFYGRTAEMQPQRARMAFVIARMEPPVTLLGGTRYFAFDLQFYMDNALECLGCAEKAAITWNEWLLYPGEQAPPISMTSTDPGAQPSVSVNCSSDCQTVSAPRRTWGALKALYR
jgi:hypothetical protein